MFHLFARLLIQFYWKQARINGSRLSLLPSRIGLLKPETVLFTAGATRLKIRRFTSQYALWRSSLVV